MRDSTITNYNTNPENTIIKIKDLEIVAYEKEDIENIKAEVYLLFDGNEEKIAECEFTKTNAYTNSMGVEFTVKVPNVKCGRFTLIISSEKDKSLNEKYELFIA